MTVTNTSNKVRFIGDASATTWPYTFPIPVATDLGLYYTDLAGATTLISPSLYSVTGIGGTTGGIVTYPLSGSPIAAGTILEILRTVPYTQAVDLINQDGFYPEVVEDGLDALEMQIQQLIEIQGRNLTVGVTDTSPGTLPAAAARALQLLGFDASGNAIAAQPSSALVSSAMAAVVAAVSLAAARTAFGLGAVATEGIGSGLEDDGAGSLRTRYPITQDSANQVVTVAYHAKQHFATAAITYTLPRANTLFNGFGFWVSALGGAVSFLIDAADGFAGMVSGTTLVIPAGTQAFISTDAANAGLWSASYNQLIGMSTPLNVQLNAAVSASALTISVKDRSGNDPSYTSPVLMAFRNPTITAGGPVVRSLVAPLSITVPSTATLGTTNGTPFRLWVVAFDNAGTIVLGVILPSTTTSIKALDESALTSATAISVGATSAQVYYGNSVVTTKAFRVLGYVEFSAGQATAGTWVTAPSKIQLFGASTKLPGMVIQGPIYTVSSVTSNSGGGGAAAAVDLTASITPTATMNLIRAEAYGTIKNTAGSSASAQLRRGIATAVGNQAQITSSVNAIIGAVALLAIDAPGTVSATSYTPYVSGAAASVWNDSAIQTCMVVTEIMA